MLNSQDARGLWAWLRAEKAIVPNARRQPRESIRDLMSFFGTQREISSEQFDEFIGEQLEDYYSRLFARAYMIATGERNTNATLAGDDLIRAFELSMNNFLSDAELSFQEYVSCLNVLVRNVAARRNMSAVTDALGTIQPEEPDINDIDLPLPTPSV